MAALGRLSKNRLERSLRHVKGQEKWDSVNNCGLAQCPKGGGHECPIFLSLRRASRGAPKALTARLPGLSSAPLQFLLVGGHPLLQFPEPLPCIRQVRFLELRPLGPAGCL